MTRETITLNARAQWRLYVLNHVLAGETSIAEAAGLLDRSTRQVRRLLARYRGPEGAAALVHGNAGRMPANRLDPALRDRLAELARTRYAGVNREHMAELLADDLALSVAPRTLRRILAEAGVPAVRRRRPRRHRTRRERMSAAGMLLQVDGSRHDWLEGRGPWLTLVGGIDDATGVVAGAIFRAQEDAVGYLTGSSRPAARTASRSPSTPIATASSGRARARSRPSPSSSRGVAPRPRWDARSRLPGSPGWQRDRPRPRAGSSACGAPCRTGCGASSGWPTRARSTRPTPSWRRTWRATTPASPSPPRIRTPRGAHPFASPRRCSASGSGGSWRQTGPSRSTDGASRSTPAAPPPTSLNHFTSSAAASRPAHATRRSTAARPAASGPRPSMAQA